ncbi:MAG: DUF3794 domain-containing protein [Clostridiaceae bacterium]|nr:DUF3794 domain-containing protein [Clostridiaceae bacterium]
MELATKNIHTHNVICRSDLQITLEDDINVPDSKPDIEQLVKTQGKIELSNVTASDEKVTIHGNLLFTLLYISSDDLRPVHSMSGQIPFQETLNMDELLPDKEVSCHYDLEDCQANLINSRKVSVRAIVGFACCQEKQIEIAAGIDIVSPEASRADMEQISSPEGLYKKHNQFALTQLVSQKKDVFRIKDEMPLPKGKPNIDTLLYYEMVPQNVQNRIVEDGIRFIGDLQVFLLYVPENEDRRLEFLETELPFDGIVRCDQCQEDMISDVEILDNSQMLELKADEDGENRIMELELNFNLQIKFYQDEVFQYLEDAYSTACTLALTKQNFSAAKLLMKNQSVVRVSDRIHVNQDMDNILQICHADGTIQIDEQEIVENGISIEGIIALDILYITENDDHPIAVAKGTIPFSHIIEIKGIRPEDDYELQPTINQISVIMLDGQEIEAKVILDLCAFVFTHNEQKLITQIQETPLDLERIQSMPGIVGYIADEESSLWNIAKEYNTTVESIIQLNHLEADHVKPGERLLLLKQLDGI